MPIQCPIQVDAIAFAEHPGFNSEKVGMLVHVKPCEESLRGKTFIGVYLGDMQISVGCSYHPESKKLEVYGTHNPAIYVPALRRVVWGCGSWWRAIKDPSQLDKEITEGDISGTWYVQLMLQMLKEDALKKETEEVDMPKADTADEPT